MRMWRVFVELKIFFLKNFAGGVFNAWEIWDATKDFSFWSIALTETTKASQISDFPDRTDTSDKTDYLIGDFSDHIIYPLSPAPSFDLFNKRNNKTRVPNKKTTKKHTCN